VLAKEVCAFCAKAESQLSVARNALEERCTVRMHGGCARDDAIASY